MSTENIFPCPLLSAHIPQLTGVYYHFPFKSHIRNILYRSIWFEAISLSTSLCAYSSTNRRLLSLSIHITHQNYVYRSIWLRSMSTENIFPCPLLSAHIPQLTGVYYHFPFKSHIRNILYRSFYYQAWVLKTYFLPHFSLRIFLN